MRGKMKAQVFYEPEDMRLEEVNIPAISEDEVLIKVRACSICGSGLFLSRKWKETNSQDFNK